MRLSGNTVLITGGSRGIGLAMAKEFIALGNQVVVTGRNPEHLALAERQVPKLVTFICDLSKKDGISALTSYIEVNHPQLNMLVNNAGIQYNYELGVDMSDVLKIDTEIQINLTAPLQLCSTLIPILRKNEQSAIVNVSSGLGLVPKASAPVYCATKAGIHIFTKALRYQMKEIKVFEVIPPLVATDMTKGRGKSKISPERLVKEFMKGLSRDRFEMNIGKTKLLRFVQRISPSIADSILRNG